MKEYNIKLGATVSTVLTLGILPIRLTTGHGDDPINLIGSETVIWFLCFTIWLSSCYIHNWSGPNKWIKLALSFVSFAIFSNLYYFITNPFFEDYPDEPLRSLPAWIALVRLSIRGWLIGLVTLPIIFLLEKQRQIQKAALERERQRTQESENQRVLLEKLVSERTQELENTLSRLHEYQNGLENNLHLLSRLVTSITHDVKTPLKYMISGAEMIDQLIQERQLGQASHWAQQLNTSLLGMSSFMNNLLSFTQAQISREPLKISHVNLSGLINEKIVLFEEIIRSKGNHLKIRADSQFYVIANDSLLSVIWHNLLDNATKYCSEGAIEITIQEIDQRLHLTIENPVDVLPVNLDENRNDPREFSHWHNKIKPTENHGIGLTLVRDIARRLNLEFTIGFSAGKVAAKVIFTNYNRQDPYPAQVSTKTQTSEGRSLKKMTSDIT